MHGPAPPLPVPLALSGTGELLVLLPTHGCGGHGVCPVLPVRAVPGGAAARGCPRYPGGAALGWGYREGVVSVPGVPMPVLKDVGCTGPGAEGGSKVSVPVPRGF